jgi:Cu(I)/Ag(I) efflux system membrane fusion protein
MDLTPVTRAALTSGEVTVDEPRRRLYGIRTATAQMKALSREVRLSGALAWDLRRQRDVPVRAAGVVEGLRVAVGSTVRKGDALFSLRSPELVAAQQDLLATAGTPGHESARRRLLALGLGTSQVDALESGGRVLESLPVLAPGAGVITALDVVEGSPVQPGSAPARIADAGSVWLEASVGEADAAALKPGTAMEVSLPSLPGRPFRGIVQGAVATETAASRVRVSVENADGALRPGQVASAKATVSLGTAVVVPADAVVYSGTRRVVFVDGGDERLVPRDVTPGVRTGDEIAIAGGLLPGERVVVGGNFLVAADSRLRSPGAWAEGIGDSAPAGTTSAGTEP